MSLETDAFKKIHSLLLRLMPFNLDQHRGVAPYFNECATSCFSCLLGYPCQVQ